MGQEEDKREEEVDAEAAVLPAREAMSLISPNPGTGFIPDLDAFPSTDAAGAASTEESVTSEDRSEHYENRDSASSET